MAMAQELAWDFHCVPRKCATNVLVATRELFLCTHLQRTWEESNGWTPQEIKSTSNMGQTRMSKRDRDAGNYFYAVLWELMDLMANADDAGEFTATPAFRVYNPDSNVWRLTATCLNARSAFAEICWRSRSTWLT